MEFKRPAFGMSGDESSAFFVNEIMAIPEDTEDPSPPPPRFFAFLNKAMPDEDPSPPVMFDDENPPLPPQRDVELALPQQHGVSVFKLKEDEEEAEQQRNLAPPVSESVLEEKEETSQNNDLAVVVSPKKTSQLKEDGSETSTLASVSTVVPNIKNIKVLVLRTELAKHNLPNVGRKSELFDRLQTCLDAEEFGQLFVAEVQVPTATVTATATTSTLTIATTTVIASPLIENGKPTSTDAIDTAVLLSGKESNSNNSSTGSRNGSVGLADDNNKDNDGYNNDVDDSDGDVTTVKQIAEGGNTMN